MFWNLIHRPPHFARFDLLLWMIPFEETTYMKFYEACNSICSIRGQIRRSGGHSWANSKLDCCRQIFLGGWLPVRKGFPNNFFGFFFTKFFLNLFWTLNDLLYAKFYTIHFDTILILSSRFLIVITAAITVRHEKKLFRFFWNTTKHFCSYVHMTNSISLFYN